mgnify:CR=1 FL=1
MSEPAHLVEAEGLSRRYRMPRSSLLQAAPIVQAVDGVSFSLAAGGSLGVVGESGSGKSTLVRLVLALEAPSAGSLRVFGSDPAVLNRRQMQALRRRMQVVFQDPFGALDPRRTVEWIVAEPLGLLPGLERDQRRERVLNALREVGLPANALGHFPHEFSGGQRQRIAIARALVTGPSLLVADEPVSALDVSVRAQVLNLLADLRKQHGLALLLISHDLAVVDYLCRDVAVMLAGRFVETAPTQRLLRAPIHPYSRRLLAAARATGRPTARGEGTKDRPLSPAGCAYALRCPHVVEHCRAVSPALRSVAPGHAVACHRAADLHDQALSSPAGAP